MGDISESFIIGLLIMYVSCFAHLEGFHLYNLGDLSLMIKHQFSRALCSASHPLCGMHLHQAVSLLMDFSAMVDPLDRGLIQVVHPNRGQPTTLVFSIAHYLSPVICGSPTVVVSRKRAHTLVIYKMEDHYFPLSVIYLHGGLMLECHMATTWFSWILILEILGKFFLWPKSVPTCRAWDDKKIWTLT